MTTKSTRTIEEVTGVLIDYRGKTPPKTAAGVKLITAKVIKDGFVRDENHEYIAENYYDAWMRRGLPQQWDILITTEAPLGEVAQLRSTERVALAQRVILLRGRSDIIDQGYLFQALKSPFAQAELRARATGTTVLGIKQSELRQVRIPYCPLPSQRKIASVLSAYDDWIENNDSRIKILEEMARAIYREWLVEFRAPRVKLRKATAAEKRATGRDAFPERWELKELGDICQEVRRSVQPNEVEPETPYFGLEHLPRRSIALGDWGEARQVQSTKLAFKEGEILFGKIRPYFHKVGIAPVDGVCSSDAIVIAPKSTEYGALVLACVSSDDFVKHASQTSQGSKMPRANWQVLVRYPLAIPQSSLLGEFSRHIDDVVRLIRNLVFANRNLRQTRDLLLPRLMSGEISVDKLEIKTADNQEQELAKASR